MADNISNEYDMIKIFKDISSNFFPSDISEERLGMFGFLSESMARLFGASLLDSNMRANEYHTITAKKLDTLMYDASVLGVDIDTTNPSEIFAYIGVNADAIKRTEYCNDSDLNSEYKTYYFIIDKDTNINISGYNFMLEWDLLVIVKHNDSEYVYSARYLSEGDLDPHDNDMCRGYKYIKENTLSELTDKYIQGSLVTVESNTMFIMKVKLRQMEKKYDYFIVNETDKISLSGLEFQYDDYLSHFNVFYRENQSSDWEYLLPISIYDSSTYNEKTIQYQIDKEARLLILNATQFEMKYNSELRVDMYTTKGSSGNITYTGDGSDISVELKSYDERHIYSGINVACMPLSSAINGRDSASIDDVRAKIIRAKASRNGLTTEYDLYNFLKDKDLINDYVFIRKRADILEHIYSAFTILRTVDGEIIPTSTLNLLVKKENDPVNGINYLDTNNSISIKTGTPYKLNDTTIENEENDFLFKVVDRLNEDGTTMTNQQIALTETDDVKIVTSPYTIIHDDINQLSSLYTTSIDKTIEVGSIPVDDELEYESNFIIDHMKIHRNAFMEDGYTIEVSVMTNGDYQNCKVGEYVNSGLSENALMLKGFVYNKDAGDMTVDSGSEYPYAFFNFDFVSFSDGVFTFKTTILVDDVIDITQEILKINSPGFMYKLRSSFTEPDPDDCVRLTNMTPNESCYINLFNLKIGLGVYYLNSNKYERTSIPTIEATATDIETDPETGNAIYSYKPVLNNGYPKFVNIIDGNPVEYILTNLYTNSSNLIDLYTDMSYISRVVSEEKIIDSEKYLLFRDVPVIQYSKALDSTISTRVTNILRDTKTYLDEMNLLLNDGFSLDYKFFRTYGPCKYFTLENSNSNIPLEKLDITLELNARLKSGVSSTDPSIISRIKTFLKTYIENINDEDDDYTIYASNITTELENNFSDILKSIDVIDINGNGDNYRVLKYSKPDFDDYAYINGRNMIKNYIPEYINLPLDNITINIIR